MRHYTESEIRLAAEMSPAKVCDYLAAKGYTRLTYYTLSGAVDVRIAPYRAPDPLGEQVEVPLNPALADHGRRMVEALDAIGEPFLGLLHAIDPHTFPAERILLLAGVNPKESPCFEMT